MEHVIEDPAVYGVNKVKPHVPLHSFGDTDEALAYFEELPDESTSANRRRLVNTRFMLVPSPGEVPAGFHGVRHLPHMVRAVAVVALVVTVNG